VKRLIEEGHVAQGAVDRLTASTSAAALTEVEADRDYRYCTELMVRSPSLPDPADVRKRCGRMAARSWSWPQAIC